MVQPRGQKVSEDHWVQEGLLEGLVFQLKVANKQSIRVHDRFCLLLKVLLIFS